MGLRVQGLGFRKGSVSERKEWSPARLDQRGSGFGVENPLPSEEGTM